MKSDFRKKHPNLFDTGDTLVGILGGAWIIGIAFVFVRSVFKRNHKVTND